MGDTVLAARKRRLGGEARLAYALLFPAVFLMVIFMVYPIIYVFIISLFKTDKLARIKNFAGLGIYASLLSSKDTWVVIGRSLLWTFTSVATKTLFGVIIALVLNVKYRGRKIARLLFIIPWASSIPISVMLWRWVLHNEFGLLNHTLRITGIMQNPPVWLGQSTTAFLSCLWVDIWIGIPFMALVFLAAMQAVPQTLYEAAEIDGASKAAQFRYVTLPGIAAILLIATLLSSLWTFNDFNTIYILTNGGPAGSTNILITYVYQNSFEWLKWQKASALSVFTFIILSTVSVLYSRIYFKKEEM
ncbi:MAG: sugar ABC transporter permease [Spirochaetes bacterium]|nr:MAG: sugar ABC transporter permease [Spirochaetota bacterium]